MYHDEMAELLALTHEELSQILGGTGRARAVWRVMLQGGDPFEDRELSHPVRARLREQTLPTHLFVEHRDIAPCGTTKLRLVLADKKRVETVVIPSRGRTTVCVSTQAGCARGCVFCLTATMGLERGLSPGEIAGQVVLAMREARARDLPEIRNVVFMGMGEPLDNFDAVKTSVSVLCDPLGLALGPTHITLSTVGTTPEVILSTRELPVQIAWSLHTVDDALRRRLVPTMRHSTETLRQAFLDRFAETGGSLFVEMTLMDRVNDALHDADELIDFLAPFSNPVRVNLLPMNPGPEGYRASSEPRVAAFQKRLRDEGLFCAVRRPRGVEKSAACGQLAIGVRGL